MGTAHPLFLGTTVSVTPRTVKLWGEGAEVAGNVGVDPFVPTFIRASREPQIIAEAMGSKEYNKWLKIQPKVAI